MRATQFMGVMALMFGGLALHLAVAQEPGVERRELPPHTRDSACDLPQVIPLTSDEPPASVIVGPPLPEPLASRGVAIIPYCAQNLRIVPVFGAKAAGVSPRVGHVHVTVDDATWHWADASGVPVILRGLAPGQHRVLLELVDANHQILDQGTVTFVVPEKTRARPQ